jgi:cardiolipin synthase
VNGVFTIPNLVSVARLALIPLFLWLLFGRDNAAAAGWLLAFIAATDWVDGYLARRLDQVSELGKLLDPVADRLAVVVAVVAGWIEGILPWWFCTALLVREGLIAVGALVIGLRAGAKLAVRPLGKLSTLLLYTAIAWLYIGKGSPLDPLVWAAWSVGVPGLVLYWIVGFQYFADARRVVAGHAG